MSTLDTQCASIWIECALAGTGLNPEYSQSMFRGGFNPVWCGYTIVCCVCRLTGVCSSLDHMTACWTIRPRIKLLSRMVGWTADMTKAHVAEWSQENELAQLDEVSRNKVICEQIARKLEEQGYHRTWQQCWTKIKNLTQKYRKVRLQATILWMTP